MKDAILYAHHSLVGIDYFGAAVAFGAVDSVEDFSFNFVLYLLKSSKFSPIIIVLAVKLRIPHITFIAQQKMTHVARQTRLVPICIGNAQIVTIVNFL